MLSRLRLPVVVWLAFLFTACATVQMSQQGNGNLQRFFLDARLSIKLERADETPQFVSGQLLWQHDGAKQQDSLQILSPFGHTLAALNRQAGLAEVTLANGRQFQAESLKALAAQGLGYELPFDALPDWLKGSGSPRAVTSFDAFQRPAQLDDGIWHVRYTYPDNHADSLPSILQISSDEGLSLRIMVDRWLTGASAHEQ